MGILGRNVIAVLDFLATKIEVSIAEKSVNNNVRLIACASTDYAGYIDGEFLEPDNLIDAVSDVLAKIRDIYPKRIDLMYVGVPAEFLNYAIKNLKASYKGQVVVKQRHIDELFQTVEDEDLDSEYIVISKSPIYFVLDDGVQTIEPVGMYTKNLASKASFVYAKDTFLQYIENVLKNCGVKESIFIPVPLAVNNTLLSSEIRQKGAIVIDFGYVSTSVTSIVGDGIVDMKTFGIGDGHILADLSEVLKLNYLEVERLKKQVILTLEANPMDVYEIVDENNNVKKINAHTTNEIIKARIESIAEVVNKILLNFQYKQDAGKEIYITGSGIIGINGVCNILSNILGRKCCILAPKQIEFAKSKFASKLGLINFAFSNII